jgi:hypothetical protein
MKKDIRYVWKEAKVLQIEHNKEAAHMVLACHPMSQPSLDISPIWTPIVATEASKLHLRPV